MKLNYKARLRLRTRESVDINNEFIDKELERESVDAQYVISVVIGGSVERD